MVLTKVWTDQWNRINNPEINSHKYSQLVFDKGAKEMQWSKEISSIHGAATTGHPNPKKVNLDTDLIHQTKVNSNGSYT